MDAAKQPNGKAQRIRWKKCLLVALAVVALITAACLLIRAGPPSPIVSATHLGGNRFALTNHTGETVSAGIPQLEVELLRENWGPITNATGPTQIHLLPHESYVFSVNLSAADSMPRRPWRLRGWAIKPIHGLESLFVRVKVCYGQISHRISGGFNPFDPRITLKSDPVVFIAYPSINTNIDAPKK